MGHSGIDAVKEMMVYCDPEQFLGGQKKYRSIFRENEVEKIYVDVILNNIYYPTNDWNDEILFLLCDENNEYINNHACLIDIKETQKERKKTVIFLCNHFKCGAYSRIAGALQLSSIRMKPPGLWQKPVFHTKWRTTFFTETYNDSIIGTMRKGINAYV